MNKVLRLSVHQLVDFLLRAGDIDNRVFNKTTMQEGTRIHAYYQNKQGNNYISEYQLCEKFAVDGFEVTLEGRSDGIIISNDEVTIDEIKSTIAPLKEFADSEESWYLGQAKCYALMYAHEKGLDKINVRLTYIHQISEEKMIRNFSYKTSELNKFIRALIREYLQFYKLIYNRTKKRNQSAKKLAFPFKSFRKGQRELAKYAYGIARDGGTLFCEAPTGIGKTISTLFPFVKSFADEKNEKIFYLTAKNSGKEAAFNTVLLLLSKGLIASAISLTAKDKICFCPDRACNPDDCPFAKGYYSKIKDVIIESIQKYQTFSKETIKSIASEYAICPFELSLDLSLYVDIIICDYNYFFDPIVYLKRYFDEANPNTLLLIDEAHNLVDRGRNMYSASLSYESFKKAKKSLKGLDHKKFKNAAKRIEKMFLELSLNDDEYTIIEKIDQKHLNAIDAYLLAAIDISKYHNNFATDEFMDFYFELNRFSKLLDYFSNAFILYVKNNNGKYITINLMCLDPSELIYRTLHKVKGKIIFSATLSPSSYYIKMLGGSEDSPLLMLPSPFKREHLNVLVAPKVSVKYKNRDSSLSEVASYIKAFISEKIGNYFVYVPSYLYLSNLLKHLSLEDVDLFIQSQDMKEEEKEAFLSHFVDKPKKTTVGLLIVGGSFSEGIDLVDERLIGVVVVGVGIPQICFERDQIKNYFDRQDEKHGYAYSYLDPGINKILQAVGRVIRTENDKGAALLIDDRYLQNPYRSLLNNKWPQYKIVFNEIEIKKELEKFWKDY